MLVDAPLKISVIIPTYNRALLLPYTLDSLDKRLHPGLDIEVLVVDDGSTDDTMQVVATRYPHVKLLRNEKKGAAAARNTGLKTAAGEYVLYLDSDDLVGPGALLYKVKFLYNSPASHACYGDYEFFKSRSAFAEADIVFQNKYEIPVVPEGVNPHLVNYYGGNYIPPHSIVWRKDFLIRLKGHDESLLINQDVDLFIRGLLAGMNVEYLPGGAKVYVRHHDTDVRVGAANSSKKVEQMLDIRKRFHRNLVNSGTNRKEYLQALSFNVFTEWRRLRDSASPMAPAFLALSKAIYWPVEMEGSFIFKWIAKFFGPDMAVRTKYFLFRRNF